MNKNKKEVLLIIIKKRIHLYAETSVAKSLDGSYRTQ